MTSQIPIDLVDPPVERKPRAKRNGNGSLVKVQEAPAPAPVSQGDAMLMLFERLARDPSIDPARIQQFLEMKREEEDRQAKRAYHAAMAAAKAEFGPIVKRHLVDFENKTGGRTTYKHEDLADISEAVDPVLARHGLSTHYRVSSEINEPVACTCIVTHSGGHFEETTLRAGADATGGKNSIQAVSSTLTYLQRMTKKAALGLAAGRDNDGKDADANASDLITDAQCQTILDKIAETEADIAKFCAYFRVDGVAKLPAKDYQRAMNLLSQKATRK